MITRVDGNDLLIVTQPHHAEMAAQLAADWGNDRFAVPDPMEPMILAAGEHDNGWREWDNRPTLNPAEGLPWTFANLDYVEHTKLYWRGVLRAAEEDPYEGLMVAMHYVGLYTQRYGTDPALKRQPATDAERAAVEQATTQGEQLQRELRKRLGGMPEYHTAASEPRIWANYKLLQTFDRLSLHLCWKGMIPYVLTNVPSGYAGQEGEIQLQPADGNRMRLTPYAFARDPLHVTVQARRVPLRHYPNDREFREAYHRAARAPVNFVLTAGS
jgi:hypothetical protein